ncbi:MAG: Y-family DNA polymerase [Lactobacillus crispatus]|uniref:Y-family DNA polymerase n=1 Tax=Lactobacillus crispatus TaxID=47770 RepID=UPI002A4C41D6|nr:Y-family DNA polymerase [Lactobacillus crispatus]MCT7802163.1 Y-family DNA polymerase [Lactobacillus crispatus]MCT7807872.1 Y-family DNA polymerase [Lactobacillus crispatus]MCT7816399.1 Y-family DNA polymerase [Lactobacillus crispatus]
MYDYKYEPHRVIFMIDNKSFFVSCEALRLGKNPMKVCLAVMSRQKNSSWGSGLIMAASPLAKKKYGLHNVMRARELPSHTPDLMIVSPHMNLYIKRSMQVLDIFREYAADEDIHMYSIDEGMIDMTNSWKLFGNDPYYVAHKMQKEIHDKLGLYTTCGIGENPLLAKLAMDIEAKHNKSMIAYWHYIDVPDKIWQIPNLEDVWGINTRTASHLRKIGINNMYELAHTNPAVLKREFGIIGEQLFAESWGVDRSIISHKYQPKAKSYGNSQVLPHDYFEQDEIEVVIRELGEQVAARIRAHNLRTGCVGLYIGFSFDEICYQDHRSGFSIQHKITPTNVNHDLVQYLLAIFRENWQGEAVRNIGVNYSMLSPDDSMQLNFLENTELQIKRYKLDHVVDKIRKKYGFSALVKASSLKTGATAIERSNLVGGHNGGNAYE